MSGSGTHVVRHQSSNGWWEMVSRAPAPRLRALVRDYQGYIESAPGVRRRRELPSGDLPLIIGFGPPLLVSYAREPERPPGRHSTFIAGLHESYATIEFAGVSHGVQINLTPIGAYMFLGQPIDALTNRVVELQDIFGADARDLVERLHAAPDWEARFCMLDTAIAARLAAGRVPAEGVAWAWQRLRQTHGRLAIGTLAEDLGWSRRHLIARFREQIGLPPKTYARILRFDRVIRGLRHTGRANWIEVAHTCGYYDQAHLIRDFREFAGAPPGEFLTRLLPNSGGINGD